MTAWGRVGWFLYTTDFCDRTQGPANVKSCFKRILRIIESVQSVRKFMVFFHTSFLPKIKRNNKIDRTYLRGCECINHMKNMQTHFKMKMPVLKCKIFILGNTCMLSCFSSAWLLQPCDHSLPRSSVHEILQAWVVMPFFRDLSHLANEPEFALACRRLFYH